MKYTQTAMKLPNTKPIQLAFNFRTIEQKEDVP